MEGKVSAAAEGAAGREGRRWLPRGQGLAGQWGEARCSSSATPLNKQPRSTPLAATARAQGKHNSIDPRKHLATLGTHHHHRRRRHADAHQSLLSGPEE